MRRLAFTGPVLLAAGEFFLAAPSAHSGALWTPGGHAISTASGDQDEASIAPDGTAGTLIVCRDRRSDSEGDIHIQRLVAEGRAIERRLVWLR